MHLLDGIILRDIKIRVSQPEPKLKFNEIRRCQEVRQEEQTASKTAVEATTPWFGMYEASLWCNVVAMLRRLGCSLILAIFFVILN